MTAGPNPTSVTRPGKGQWFNATSSVLATAAIGALQYAAAISLAALIFIGPLNAGAGKAASAFVASTMVASLAIGARSRMTTAIGGAQDTAAIVAAAVAASIAAEVAVDAAVPTTLAMLAIAAIITGVAMWLVGHFGYASFVRFLPYPVVSGFMAGTGWLLLRGGVEVMLRRTIHMGDLAVLTEWSTLKFAVPGLALAVFMTVCSARGINGVVISGSIVACYLAFHLIGRIVSNWQVVENDGWLVGPFPDGATWPPLRPADLPAIDWGALGSQAIPILTIAAVSVLGLMLNLSGLEEVLGEEINVDHEFEVVGAANIILGSGSGLVSYHLIGDTTLARQLGLRSRRVPLAIGAIGLFVLVIGADLIAQTPRVVAGGVLSGLGMNLLVTWARGSFVRMNSGDRVVTLLILVTIAAVGILSGIAAGLLLAVVLFVVRYSQADPVRPLTHTAGRSNVDRTEAERLILQRGSSCFIATELQGYLFFGSVRALHRSLDQRLSQLHRADTADIADTDVRTHVLLDFARVPGIDSTAASALVSRVRRLDDEGVVTSWSGLSLSVHNELEAAGAELDRSYVDLDHAIAAAEDDVIARFSRVTDRPDGDALNYPPALLAHAGRRTLKAGDVLVEAGDTDDDVFFVEQGTLTAWSALADGSRTRLRQVAGGSVLGEVSFSAGTPRTATVVADGPATVLALSRASFEELCSDDPSAAVDIQTLLLQRLAERLTDTSGALRDVLS